METIVEEALLLAVAFVLIPTTGVPRLHSLLEVEAILIQDLPMAAIIEALVVMVAMEDAVVVATTKVQKSRPMTNFTTVMMFLLETREWN
jgi:hypothetical protein